MASLKHRRHRRDGRGDRRRSTRSSEVVAAIDGYVVARQRQLHPPGRHRRRHRRPSARAVAALQRARAPGDARCRSATPSTPRSSRRPASRCGATLERLGLRAAAAPDRRQRRRRALPDRRRRARSGCSTSSRARSPRRCSSSRACRRSTTPGARVFVEVGPKRALQGFAADVLGDDDGPQPLHQPPEGRRRAVVQPGAVRPLRRRARRGVEPAAPATSRCARGDRAAPAAPRHAAPARTPAYGELGRLFAEFLERGRELTGAPTAHRRRPSRSSSPAPRSGSRAPSSCSTTPTSRALLDGEQFIDVIPARAAPRDARQAHHAAGEERRRQRALRDDRRARRRDQARRARRRVRPRARSSASTPTALAGARPRHAARDRRRHRRAARRRHPARPALQDDHARAPSCPTAGGCPTRCATTPA